MVSCQDTIVTLHTMDMVLVPGLLQPLTFCIRGLAPGELYERLINLSILHITYLTVQRDDPVDEVDMLRKKRCIFTNSHNSYFAKVQLP